MKAPATAAPATPQPAERQAAPAAQADHRPAAVAQRQLQAALDASSRQVAQRQAQAALDASPRQVAQRQQAAATQPRPNRTGLPDQLKAGVENLSGYSLDDVKVHYNSARPAQLQAHAYAQGTDIHVAPGQEKHLPHEAWHVVQQKQGRVRATRQMRGVRVNDNNHLEQEADRMGAEAAKEQMSTLYVPNFSSNAFAYYNGLNNSALYGNEPIQCVFSTIRKGIRSIMPKTMWHNDFFNNIYNNIPFIGTRRLKRGMEITELQKIVEQGRLESRSMKDMRKDREDGRTTHAKQGDWGPFGREQHLKQSHQPKSQYVSAVEPNQQNSFGTYQVPIDVPAHRVWETDSSEPQSLIEGGSEIKNKEEVKKFYDKVSKRHRK